MLLFRKSLALLILTNPSYSNLRSICTGSVLYGKRNFRKFHYPNKRGNAEDKKWLLQHPEEVDHRGMREYGYREGNTFHPVPEMIPELIVPNLENFTLKPYVSYRTQDISQEKFTAEHLFYATYEDKIRSDFENKQLDKEGNPLNPNDAEKMTPEEAKTKIRQTGSDLFG